LDSGFSERNRARPAHVRGFDVKFGLHNLRDQSETPGQSVWLTAGWSCAARGLALGLTLFWSVAYAQAADSVSIRVFPGYPLLDKSVEKVEVRIDRVFASRNARDLEVDRFFSSVEATLTEHGITRDWQQVIPDAPYIEITIELNGRRTRLASAHLSLERSGNLVVTERGVETLKGRARDAVLSQQSEEFRRRRLAFERLLELSLEHTRGLLKR
jgi:hypothetical protein